MKASEFRALLQLAISGERTAVEALISLYMPLINRYSVIDGKFDDDCRQYILAFFIKNLVDAVEMTFFDCSYIVKAPQYLEKRIKRASYNFPF